jgi:hypothetical protein
MDAFSFFDPGNFQNNRFSQRTFSVSGEIDDFRGRGGGVFWLSEEN